MHGRHLAPAVRARVIEGELDDATRSLDGDGLERDARVAVREPRAVALDPLDQLLGLRGALLVLDPRVEVLGVLAHDDEVDVLKARAHSGVGLARPHLPEQVERFAEAHVDRAEADPYRSRDRPLERDPVAPDRLERLLRQRVAAKTLHDRLAGALDIPVERDSGGLEHAARRLGQFRPGSVAWNESHAVGHGCLTLPSVG